MTRRRARVLAVCAAVFAASATTLAAADDAGWTLSKRDPSPDAGYALYRRQAPGEEFSTWRLTTELAAPPELVERATLRSFVEGPVAPPAGRRQRLLRREGKAFWIHTEIEVSIAADRDVILRIERRRDAETGALRIEWRADPDAGPPPRPGIVRLQVSRGFWEFTPVPGGRTRAHYESYADPGGPFPHWLVDAMNSREVMEGLAQLRNALADPSLEPRPAVESSFGG